MTPWRDRLFFGRTYEDRELDAELLPLGRVFCVAGAGETAFRLARDGREVVVVDVNPAQVAYVRERIAGAPPRDGVAERVQAIGRQLVGWRRDELERFLALDDLRAQATAWPAFETARYRALTSGVLRPAVLRPLYRDAAKAVPDGATVRDRLRRGFATHANASNPYARLLLLGTADPEPPAHVELAVADAVDYLAAAPRASFDGFALSNVADGAQAGFRERLLAAVAHAARPGAVALLRSFAGDDELARRDRSLLWGRIECFTF